MATRYTDEFRRDPVRIEIASGLISPKVASDLRGKRTVLRLMFAAPVVVSRETGVRTGEFTPPFRALALMKGGGNQVVPKAGLEPARYHQRGILKS